MDRVGFEVRKGDVSRRTIHVVKDRLRRIPILSLRG